jgi:hypothetical protein
MFYHHTLLYTCRLLRLTAAPTALTAATGGLQKRTADYPEFTSWR